MDQEALLNQSLKVSPIPSHTTLYLRTRLWGQNDTNTIPAATHNELRPYFDYYSSRCLEFLTEGGRNVMLRTHQDVVRVADMIRDDFTKAEAVERLLQGTSELKACSKTSRIIETSIDICGGLLAMTVVGEHEFGIYGHDAVPWRTGTLRQAIRTRFSPETNLQPSNLILDKIFTALNLTRIAGISIIWTNNIANHLLLTEEENAVFIFHQASFLKMQERTSNPLFPLEFLEETLRTLALLFPQNNSASRDWVWAKTKAANIDPMLVRCGYLRPRDRRFERFSVWHDRLVVLKQAFDDSKPRNISQWWWDRRDGVQWYTFWVAVLVFAFTLFFGSVQCIEGALQVYLTYKAQPG